MQSVSQSAAAEILLRHKPNRAESSKTHIKTRESIRASRLLCAGLSARFSLMQGRFSPLCLFRNRWICARFYGDFPRWRQCPHLLLVRTLFFLDLSDVRFRSPQVFCCCEGKQLCLVMHFKCTRRLHRLYLYEDGLFFPLSDFSRLSVYHHIDV